MIHILRLGFRFVADESLVLLLNRYRPCRLSYHLITEIIHLLHCLLVHGRCSRLLINRHHLLKLTHHGLHLFHLGRGLVLNGRKETWIVLRGRRRRGVEHRLLTLWVRSDDRCDLRSFLRRNSFLLHFRHCLIFAACEPVIFLTRQSLSKLFRLPIVLFLML